MGLADYALLKERKVGHSITDGNMGSLVHEFVQNLAGEIGQEYNACMNNSSDPAESSSFADIL